MAASDRSVAAPPELWTGRSAKIVSKRGKRERPRTPLILSGQGVTLRVEGGAATRIGPPAGADAQTAGRQVGGPPPPTTWASSRGGSNAKVWTSICAVQPRPCPRSEASRCACRPLLDCPTHLLSPAPCDRSAAGKRVGAFCWWTNSGQPNSLQSAKYGCLSSSRARSAGSARR